MYIPVTAEWLFLGKLNVKIFMMSGDSGEVRNSIRHRKKLLKKGTRENEIRST